MTAGPEFEIKVGSTEQFGYIGIKPVPSKELLSDIAPYIKEATSSSIEALRKGVGDNHFVEIAYIKGCPDTEVTLGVVTLKALYENGNHTANLDCTSIDLSNGGELF